MNSNYASALIAICIVSALSTSGNQMAWAFAACVGLMLMLGVNRVVGLGRELTIGRQLGMITVSNDMKWPVRP